MITSTNPCPVCGGHEWRAYLVSDRACTDLRRMASAWVDIPIVAAFLDESRDIDICTTCECIVSAGGIFSQRGEP